MTTLGSIHSPWRDALRRATQRRTSLPRPPPRRFLRARQQTAPAPVPAPRPPLDQVQCCPVPRRRSRTLPRRPNPPATHHPAPARSRAVRPDRRQRLLVPPRHHDPHPGPVTPPRPPSRPGPGPTLPAVLGLRRPRGVPEVAAIAARLGCRLGRCGPHQLGFPASGRFDRWATWSYPRLPRRPQHQAQRRVIMKGGLKVPRKQALDRSRWCGKIHAHGFSWCTFMPPKECSLVLWKRWVGSLEVRCCASKGQEGGLHCVASLLAR